MWDVDDACREFYSTFFAAWCCENPEVARYVSVVVFDGRSGETQSEFTKTRRRVHQQVLQELHKFSDSVSDLMTKMEHELKVLSARPFPSPGQLIFNTTENMTIRKVAFLEIEILRLKTAIFNKKFARLSDLYRRACTALSLLEEPALFPECLYLTLESNFFFMGLDDITSIDTNKVYRLISCHKALLERIKTFQKPVWLRDYPKFLNTLIDKALSSHLYDQGCSYVPYIDGEVSLSRCFFESDSRYVVRIDDVICKNINKADFISHILNLCFTLIPERETMPPARQSVALLMIFRAVFHRFYEKFSSLLYKPPSPDLKNVWVERETSVSQFSLPEMLMSRGWDGDASVLDVFSHEPLFVPASQFLFMSIFEANPIDAIYLVHKALLSIKKGAIVNGSRVDADQIHKFVCFDDFFSLFIGALLASDVPDIFHLTWFVSTYLPKEGLSADLFYASANLEALASHFHDLSK